MGAVCCCSEAVEMYFCIFILSVVFHLAASDSISFTKTASVTYSGTTKTATCDITVSYSGNEVDSGSITCSISWPKNKLLDKKNIKIPVVVGSPGNLFIVEVKFELFKKNGKPASTNTKTKNPTFKKQNVDVDNGDASSPWNIWCPGEDTIIWTPEYSVVNESSQNSWQDCAQLCATFLNENGNAPCFSWTYNNAEQDMYGLAAGTCRLLPYSPVFRMEATGVQSGYWKCWKAYSTSVSP